MLHNSNRDFAKMGNELSLFPATDYRESGVQIHNLLVSRGKKTNTKSTHINLISLASNQLLITQGCSFFWTLK